MGDFSKGGVTQNRWALMGDFQRGEYIKPMGFGMFFLLLLKIKRPGRLFRPIRYIDQFFSSSFDLESSGITFAANQLNAVSRYVDLSVSFRVPINVHVTWRYFACIVEGQGVAPGCVKTMPLWAF